MNGHKNLCDTAKAFGFIWYIFTELECFEKLLHCSLIAAFFHRAKWKFYGFYSLYSFCFIFT